MSSRKTVLILLLILALGFTLRVIGINFGLPYLYNADEPNIVNHAVAYGTGDLNPHYFKVPVGISYFLCFEYGLYFLIGKAIGFIPSLEAFKTEFFTDPTNFYLIGRITLGLIPGVLTILVVYFIGRKLCSSTVGLIAAAFFSVNFLHVRNCHYVYLDIPFILFLSLAFLWSLKVYERGSRSDYIWTGVWVALSTAMKYNGCLIFAPFFLAHILRYPAREWFSALWKPRFFWSVLLIPIVFIATNPFLVIDWRTALVHLGNIAAIQISHGWMHHITYSLFQGMGALMFLWCACGLFLALFLLGKRGVIFVSFPVSFYILLSNMSQVHARYVLPLILFLVISGAFFATVVFLWLKSAKLSWLKIPFAVAVILMTLPTTAKSVMVDYLFLQEDTRTQAKEWIEANIRSGANIAFDHAFFRPPVLLTREQIISKKELVHEEEKDLWKRRALIEGEGHYDKKQAKIDILLGLVGPDDKRYNLFFLVGDTSTYDNSKFIFAEPVLPFDMKVLKENSVKYVCVTKELRDVNKGKPFYAELTRRAKLVKIFTPYRDSSVEEPFNTRDIRTGAPLLTEELFSRKSNGEIIEVYEL